MVGYNSNNGSIELFVICETVFSTVKRIHWLLLEILLIEQVCHFNAWEQFNKTETWIFEMPECVILFSPRSNATGSLFFLHAYVNQSKSSWKPQHYQQVTFGDTADNRVQLHDWLQISPKNRVFENFLIGLNPLFLYSDLFQHH